MSVKVFKDLGFSFSTTEGCITCGYGSCHGNAVCVKNDISYNITVHINNKTGGIVVSASSSANTVSNDDIEEHFTKTETEKARNFLRDNFPGFKCL